MTSSNGSIMLILSSPSGAGKTTLTKKIQQKYQNFKISISHTTRKPRTNEIEGVDYFFVSHEEFKNKILNNEFYEHAKIFDNYYGTSRESVNVIIKNNHNILFDIDWQGTQQLKKVQSLSLVTFFILPPNIKVLKQRLLNRHEGQEKVIEERMKKFNEELSHWSEYNHVVVNDDLETCYKKISDIIISEKKGIRPKSDLNEIKKKVEQLFN